MEYFGICPICGATSTEPPALSRQDDKTHICPECGIREALAVAGVSTAMQNEIIKAIHMATKTK